MPFMSSREMDMVGAALDVFMDVFIERLEAFTGTISSTMGLFSYCKGSTSCMRN